MSRMNCSDFANQIDAWLSSVRSDEARAHFNECTSCRELVDDLGIIRDTARSWGSDVAVPAAHVWTSLRTQLEHEGLIRVNDRDVRMPAPGYKQQNVLRWFGGILSAVPRPVMAAAYLAAIVAFSTTMIGPTSRQLNDSRWFERTQNNTRQLSAQLDADEAAAVSSVTDSPVSVGASLNNGLTIVDNYIALCEKSVREEPGNEMARDYLYTAYQQKADLLAQMDELGYDGR